jgi:hypothetical protein
MTAPIPYDALKEHDFMHGLKDQQLTKLATLCTAVTFQDDELILKNGQRSEFFYLILTGSASVELRARAIYRLPASPRSRPGLRMVRAARSPGHALPGPRQGADHRALPAWVGFSAAKPYGSGTGRGTFQAHPDGGCRPRKSHRGKVRRDVRYLDEPQSLRASHLTRIASVLSKKG